MLQAWEQLQRIRRDQAALIELPVAQLTSLMANINRDSKRAPKPFSITDFTLFRREKTTSDDEFPPLAATVALALRHEGRLPSVLIGVWSSILASAGKALHPPKLRALISDDNEVALLAPVPEGTNFRGLLAVGTYPMDGVVRLRDVDRPLVSYEVRLAPSTHVSYVVSGELVKVRES